MKIRRGKMTMKTSMLMSVIVAGAVALGVSSAAFAQDNSQKSATPVKHRKPANPQAPAAKTHKVWTEDDLARVRTPADRYAEKESAQVQAATTAQQAEATEQSSATAAKPQKTAPLAHANSADDADKKIAWEQRDIEGQEEFIDGLRQELRDAAPDRIEHLQKLIQDHKQILADTRKELAGLQAQKKEFEKPAASSVTPAAQAPSE